MAEVVSIKGGKIETEDGRDILVRLKDLVAKIEAGELKPEKWMLLVEIARKDDPAIISTQSFDSGITLSEAVYMLSGSIYDLHWKARDDVPPGK